MKDRCYLREDAELKIFWDGGSRISGLCIICHCKDAYINFFLIILSNMPVLYREHRTSWARTSSPSAADNVINCRRSFSSVWMSFSSLYPILHQSQSTSVGVRRGVRKSSCLVATGKKGGFRALCGQRVTWGELLCTPLPGESQAHLCGEIGYYCLNLVLALKGYKCK